MKFNKDRITSNYTYEHKVDISPPGPNAAKIISIINEFSYDSTFTYPLVIASGHDCTIKDVDGNTFLDFTSNIGTCPLGYSHPEIVEILKQHSKSGIHKIAGPQDCRTGLLL